MSFLTCQMQNSMSMSTPSVHMDNYSNNSFSNQHNIDPMQMQWFGQCDYIPYQHSMPPANNSSHCMAHTTQYRPHNLICMCGTSHCTSTPASSNNHHGNPYVCNEPTLHHRNNCNCTCSTQHGSQSIAINSVHDTPFTTTSQLDSVHTSTSPTVNTTDNYSKYCDKELRIVLKLIDSVYARHKQQEDINYIPDDSTDGSTSESDESAPAIKKKTLPGRKPKVGADPKYKCKYCGITLISNKALDSHLGQHEGITFVCPDCGKTLKSN